LNGRADWLAILNVYEGLDMADREFNTGEPLGYLITWTTYGTWLPGDERGWQRSGQAGIQLPNQTFREMAAADMGESAFYMEDADRQIVDNTVASHCEIRNWILHISNARTNHVHVVVTAPGYKPEVVRDQFKAWCTRYLKPRHMGRERFWTEGASCRWINHPEDLESAILYAADAQDRKDRE